MSNNFSRTLRALRADGWASWAVRAFVAALLLSLWSAWFFWGRITVWAVSESARAEVRDEVFLVDAPVDGQVVAVHIERGQQVVQDQVLVELETSREEGERDALAADLEALRAQENELVARIDRERRNLVVWRESHPARASEGQSRVRQAESAALLARSEEESTRKLFEQDLAPRGDLDKAVSELRQAEEQVVSLKAAADLIDREHDIGISTRTTEIETLKGNLSVLQAEILSSETTLANLEQEVSRRQIKAPASGTLAAVTNLRQGTVVEAGDELARIVPTGQIRAFALFRPADAVGRIRAGQAARMRLEGFPSTQFGTVPATVAVVDRETTNGRIRVDFDIAEQRPMNIELQHGMVGSIEVEVDRLSPASLLLRAVGKLLDRPTERATESLAEAG